MKHLYHWHMGVEMRGGRDVWRLTGEYEGEEIYPSCPVAMEQTSDGTVITTASGSKYLLMNCEYPNRIPEYLADIQDVIDNKGWKVLP